MEKARENLKPKEGFFDLPFPSLKCKELLVVCPAVEVWQERFGPALPAQQRMRSCGSTSPRMAGDEGAVVSPYPGNSSIGLFAGLRRLHLREERKRAAK
jgi:hypothetical protein